MELGTAKENAADKVARGRAPKPNARLTLDQVNEIRERLRSGEFHHDIAVDYGVCRATISQINRGAIWQ